MIESIFWIILSTALISFCTTVAYKRGHKVGINKGYVLGVETVIAEWKKTLRGDDDIE